MKKILFSIMALALLCSVSYANCSENCEKVYPKYDCRQQSPCAVEQKKSTCDDKNYEKKDCKETDHTSKCNKCLVDDDEYCVYNECFFDKHYRKMKKALCLSQSQETAIDNIYRNFKADMELQHTRYRNEKNKLLEMIECQNDCWKEQRNKVKEICKETKEKCKEFNEDIKEQLCKDQYGDFRRFKRQEKRKMKKIIKYGAIYKLPCKDCCSK